MLSGGLAVAFLYMTLWPILGAIALLLVLQVFLHPRLMRAKKNHAETGPLIKL